MYTVQIVLMSLSKGYVLGTASQSRKVREHTFQGLGGAKEPQIVLVQVQLTDQRVVMSSG